jgi:hypothetical protein
MDTFLVTAAELWQLVPGCANKRRFVNKFKGYGDHRHHAFPASLQLSHATASQQTRQNLGL